MAMFKNFWNTNKQLFLLILLYFFIFMLVATLMLIVLTRPSGKVEVPSLIGKRFVSVYNTLEGKGLRANINFFDVFDVEDGVVLNQYPESGTIVSEGHRLNLVVSKNKTSVEVPSLVGKNLSIAKNKLKNLHIGKKTVSLGVGVISYIPSEKSSGNIILDQNPKPGEKISPDSKVNLLISAGKVETEMKMPYLKGQSIDLSFDLLLAKGVNVIEEIVEVGPKRSGKIISQKPYAGEIIKKGSTVKLKIGYYPMKERLFSGYEKIMYKIPEDEKKGLYEAYIEDGSSRRIRYSRILKPEANIEFLFFRKGNARVTILCDKKIIKVFGLNVEAFE